MTCCDSVHMAASCGHMECIYRLRGENFNSPDSYGEYPTCSAINNNNLGCLILLACFGANLKIIDKNGRTLFHQCCMSGSTGCLKFLLENTDIDVNLKDNGGNSALHYAAARGFISCLRLLLDVKEIMLNDLNGMEETAIGLAKKYSRTVCVDFLEKYCQ